MMFKFDKNIWLASVIILVIIGALAWIAFFWQFGNIKNISENIQKEQLDSQVRQERNQKVSELSKELGNVEERQEEMKSMLINKDDAVPFLRSLEAVAQETNNSIKISVTDPAKLKSLQKKSASQKSDTEDEDIKDVQKDEAAKKKTQAKDEKQDFSNQLAFSLELSGNFRSSIDFLSRIENLPFFMKVWSIDQEIEKTTLVKSPANSAGPATLQETQSGPENADRNIKSTIVIVVYANGSK